MMRDFESASRRALQFLRDQFGFDLWMVTRVEGDHWVVLSAEDHGYGVKAGHVFKWSESLCARMAHGEGPNIAPDADQVPAYRAAPIRGQLDIGAYVGFPLRKADGSLFGTLCGFHPEKKFDESVEQLGTIKMIADMLGCILNIELQLLEAKGVADRADSETGKDALTGLFNRRLWVQFLNKEEHRCRRYGHPASVIAIELADLKGANETLGFARGDQMLKLAAGAISSSVRNSDIAARTAGDKFMILCVECDLDSARIVVGRLEETFRLNAIGASIGLKERNPENGLYITCDLAEQDMVRRKALLPEPTKAAPEASASSSPP